MSNLNSLELNFNSFRRKIKGKGKLHFTTSTLSISSFGHYNIIHHHFTISLITMSYINLQIIRHRLHISVYLLIADLADVGPLLLPSILRY